MNNVSSVTQDSYDVNVVQVVTTTVAITTTTCACTVVSHAIAKNICRHDKFVVIETPAFRTTGCPDSSFTSYRITQLPNGGGTLKVDGTAVTLNQDLSKEQMAKLVYELNDAVASADNAKFTVRTSCGTSSAYNIDITVITCETDGCADCVTTTTVTTTTTP